MKSLVPSPVFAATLMAGALMAGCAPMGGSSGQATAMPQVDSQRVCEIQRQWTRMSPDEQTAALSFHMRNTLSQYSSEDVAALRRRVQTEKC